MLLDTSLSVLAVSSVSTFPLALRSPSVTALAVQSPEVSLWLLTVAGVIAIAILMVVSGFYSSSEIAMFALPAHRLDALAADGVPNAVVAKRLREEPRRLLVTILVGNNVANVAMSSVATALLGFYVSGWLAVVLATVGITSLVLLFSESAPKSYAVEHTESWALRIARPLRLSGYLLHPFVVVFDALTKVVNDVLGAGTDMESAYVTRGELRRLIDVGHAEGAIEAEERDRLLRTFRFSETPVREVMVPRPDIVAVATADDLDDALQTCAYTGFTHLPVYEDDLDEIVGTVHVCDLVRDRLYGERPPGEIEASDLMRPTLHVPETIPVDEVLSRMQREHVHLAAVIDEYGTTEGIVTTEDPTELIVGEILQPRERTPIRVLDERTARVRGDVAVAEVNDALDLSIPESTAYDTVAGYLITRVGRLVDEGEQFRHEDARLEVETVVDSRIASVRIVCDEPFDDE